MVKNGSKLKIITTAKAPAAVGPYSQAVVAGNLMFVSGQLPMNPYTGEMVSGDIQAMTHQVIRNIRAIAEANDTDLSRVVKTTVFLTDMQHFTAVNTVYAQYFGENLPARSAIQVAALPKGAQVEIESIFFLET